MITVTVIKSPKVTCKNCSEAHLVVEEVLKSYQEKCQLEVLLSNTPEAQSYGMISTPVVAINKRIYSMGKPVIRDQVDKWVQKELGQ